MQVRPPQTDEEFARYYDLRWQILRAPWRQSRGSERDELETTADHAAVFDERGAVLAIGRLHLNSPTEAQIRYMAVADVVRGQGVGRQIDAARASSPSTRAKKSPASTNDLATKLLGPAR
jgi:GNAT superfamily N-acetyltransferase